MRSRSASIAARSMVESAMMVKPPYYRAAPLRAAPSDPEEHVQEAVGERRVAPVRTGVDAAERGERQRRRIELEHDGQVVDVPRFVDEPFRSDADTVVGGA